MQLSKHFTLKEMTKSMTAQRKGIDNTPGSGEIKSLGDLCYEVLEPLRAHFDRPVTITSGYRSEAQQKDFTAREGPGGRPRNIWRAQH